MKKLLISLITFIFIGSIPVFAAPVKIIAALPDLGSIASYIGGDKVDVISIGKNNSNPHSIEVFPSYIVKVSRADIYLKVGLSLDQWSNELIDGSRNNKILVVDCSHGISVLEKPAGKIDASLGDVHPEGNSHYWLDPSNGIIIANNVLSALEKVDPLNSSYYEKNYANFKNETENRITGWKSKMLKLSGKKIISYHSSWVYFASVFNLNIAGNVEPLPGIPPTGKHLSGLANLIKRDSISILLQESYFPDKAPEFLANQTGIKIFKFAPSCSDIKRESYFKHFDEIIDAISR
ncbi:MAG: metal ABC transporter substrate-binding protein [bacterium]|nr:metal ABC transporter substrate-binding protein [bacterium]